MLNSITNYFWGGENPEAMSDPVEMNDMAAKDKEPGVTSPEDPMPGLKNPCQLPSLGVTQSVSYIEFFPRCLKFSPAEGFREFDPFSSVIEQANHWLSDNPQYRLLKCESLRKKLLDGPKIEFDSVIHHESSNGKNYFLNGLRLWVRGRQPSDSESYQQIGCLHSVPWLSKDCDVSLCKSQKLNPEKFLSLTQKIECLNASLKQKQLPGSILTVESLYLRSSDPLELPGWSPERSCWLEDGSQKIVCVKILRIFYLLGEHTTETIGVENFLPKVTKEAMSSISKPQFQPFSEVVSAARVWLQANKEFRIVNIQSSITKVEQKNTGKAISFRNSMVFTENANDVTMYLKLLTVFYVRKWKAEKVQRVDLKVLNVTPSNEPITNISTCDSATVHKPQTVHELESVTSSHEPMTSPESSAAEQVTSSDFVDNKSVSSETAKDRSTGNKTSSSVLECFSIAVDIPNLTCKLFPPRRRGPKSFESFSRTVDQTSYWIKCNKSPLLFLESTQTLFTENMHASGVKEDMVLCEINRQVGRYYLTSLWGYFADKTVELVLEQVTNPYVKIGEVSEESAEAGVV